MIIVSYDFSSNRRRSKFSKFLEKYGRRIQYSVFEIKNSERALQNIEKEIELIYKPYFKEDDSIVIFYIGDCCKKKIKRYGNAVHEEEELIFFK
ncbi:MAG: CRISPR-associated endonuclease Cas2 [Patescibacteria group bacterium]